MLHESTQVSQDHDLAWKIVVAYLIGKINFSTMLQEELNELHPAKITETIKRREAILVKNNTK